MKTSNCRWSRRVRAFFIGVLCVWPTPFLSLAQTSDITSSGLGTHIGTPTPLPNGMINYDITGGTRPGNGLNLFHSFGEFSVGSNNIANFLNETSLPTSNILSRVTNGNPSNIFGTLQTTDFGAANLYLINPAGVIFGPTASLNVGGSFAASTANYLKMTDGAAFYANPAQPTVLSIAPVSAFGFLAGNPAVVPQITVLGSTLQVDSSKSLSIIGGDFTMTGGTLSAPSGSINLASLGQRSATDNVEIPIDLTKTTTRPEFGDSSFFDTLFLRGNGGLLNLSQGAILNVGNGASAGALVIRGGQLLMDNGIGSDIKLVNATISVDQGITLSATQVMISGGTLRSDDINFDPTSSYESGKSIAINADYVTLNNGAEFFTGSAWGGPTGNLTIQGLNSTPTTPTLATKVEANNILLNADGGPLAGNIMIHAKEMTFAGSRASTINFGNSPSGDILFDVGTFSSSESILRTVALDTPRSGSVTIGRVDGTRIDLTDTTIDAQYGKAGFSTGGAITLIAPTITLTRTTLNNQGSGGGPSGGAVNIQTDNLSLESSNILVQTTGTQATGGSVTVQGTSGAIGSAPSAIFISNSTISSNTTAFVDGTAGIISLPATTSLILSNSNIATSAEIEATAGSITLQAPTIIMNGGSLKSETQGNGSGGSVLIKGNTFTVQGNAVLSSSNSGTPDPFNPATGSAGSIMIQGLTSPAATVTIENATIRTDAGKVGSAGGNIDVVASTFTMNGGAMSAETGGVGASGTILLNAGNVALGQGSIISTSSTSTASPAGEAGDITLVSATDLTMKGSTISTAAAQSSGGNIKLTAPNLVRIVDSTISSSVKGSALTVGGNIDIDPQLVVIQNSQILANADAGAGGNITIAATGAVLVDPNSRIDASAGPAGISGSVNINSPIQVLSGALVPLNLVYSQAGLSGDRCAADPQGQFSSFVQTGRDGVPQVPGALSPSPLSFLGALTSGSLGSQLPNVAAARLGLNSVRVDDSTLFQFHSACRS